MKKTVCTFLFLSLLFSLNAQTHLSKSINLSIGAGINDFRSWTPDIGVQYVFYNWLNLGVHYNFCHAKVENIVNVWEHNIELVSNFTPVQVKEKFFINLGVGVGLKNTQLAGIPRANYKPPTWNVGMLGNIEVEYAFLRYFSAFAKFVPKIYFIDIDTKLRYELFGAAGIKVNLQWLFIGVKQKNN